jgi:hypothetical protein
VVLSREELNRAVTDAQVDATTGVLATAAGIALGANPVVATVVGASGPALKLAHRVLSRARERREDRVARTIEQAAEILDVGLDIFEERATSYDDRLELLARVLEAAARTPLEEKVTALARVLAEGLRDGESVNEALVIAAALADIEAAHVYVLHHLAVTPLPPEQLRRPNHPEPRGWEAAQIAAAVPEVTDILDGLLAVLSGHGLIRDQGGVTYPGGVGPAVWRLTALGRRCLLLLGKAVPETRTSCGE